MPERPFDRERLVRIFFFSAFAFLLYQLFLLSRPFLPSLLFAAMLSISFYPAYRKVVGWVKNSNIAALLLTVGVMLAVLVPLALMAWTTFRESSRIMPVAQSLLDSLNR
ncbi:MAG: hypothetical protein JO102_06470, partial [Elusimicrobia bacterium]|nr:hypothetical protein [Elusimicrobiota bacterium]